MDPVFGGLLAGGLAGGLDLFGGLLTNSANAAEGARNRRFIAAMYKKRYQNTTADMRKAGLNPVLAAMNGGAVGSVPSPGGLPSFDNALGSAAHSAMSAAQGVASIRKTDADTTRAAATTKSINQDVISKTIKNKYLEPQEEAMVKDAIARAANNAALAELNSARAEYSDSLAFNEYSASALRNERETQSIRNEFTRDEILRRSPEYTMSAAERRLLERVKAVMGSVNSATGSFLSSVKALRYLRY